MAKITVTGVKAKRVRNFAHFYVAGSRVFDRGNRVDIYIKDDSRPEDAQSMVQRLITVAKATSVEVA